MPRSYADNAYNRSVGRVGLPMGSAVISSGGSSGGGSYRASGGGGSSYGGGGRSSTSSASASATYVDNSMNRSLGRVGLPLGSAVHSRSSESSSANTYSRSSYGDGYSSGGTYGDGYSSGGGRSSTSSASVSGTYVDNSMNRSLGRVGLPLGSVVHSKSSADSSSSKTYVDNSVNRDLGRVGLPHGSAVQSSSKSQSSSGISRAYVDSGRVGLPSGAAPNSRSELKTYVDNAYNRKLGRVGLLYGSGMTQSSMSTGGQGQARTYVDNAMNRKLGRVGKPLGSCPMSKGAGQSDRQPKYVVFEPLRNFDWEDDNILEALRQIQQHKCSMDVSQTHLADKATEVLHRHEATKAFSKRGKPSAPSWVKGGEIIEYDELSLGDKIGGGGFGDVHAAIWNNQQVAVKKLRVQRVSQEKKRQFQEEVLIYSGLDHKNIVKFHGVCVTPPNLAIVMEFMSGGSLYDVIHVETRTIEMKTKIDMFLDCARALKYLHQNGYAHRDMKTMNILVTDDYLHCKLGDFGLALKETARSSASVADHGVVGTLKYSPPEVVEGNRLTLEQLKQADIYSLGVVGVELMTEEEPYDGLNQFQVRKAILDEELPSMDKIWDGEITILLRKCLMRNKMDRPSAAVLYSEWKECARMIEFCNGDTKTA